MSDDGIEARIFVGGLDHECDEAALDKAFSMFGEITQITIMRDRETQNSRGFGFISFDSQEAADDAIRRMHGVEVMGRCVTVRKAEKQSVFPDRGGYRGRGRGSFRGGRGGGDYGNDRYDSRGRGSYGGGRSSDGYSRGHNSSNRGSYNSSRRGGYVTSRLGYRSQDNGRSGGYDDRRSGYDNPRQGGYRDDMSDEFDDMAKGHGGERYSNSRKNHPSERYSDSYKGTSRGYDDGPPSSRDGYSQSMSRYETSSGRPRSRSPIVRYVYREESPVHAKNYDYSPSARRHAVREYSPVPPNSRSHMSKGYSRQESKEVYREYSPPARSRGPPRDVSPDNYPPPRSRGRPSSPPPSSSRMRNMSPDAYQSSRNRGRAGSPRERSSYMSSRSSGGAPNKSSMSRKGDYSSSRSQDSRGERYTGSSSRDYHRGGMSGRSSGGADRGAGISTVLLAV